jgi:hypothetical protein
MPLLSAIRCLPYVARRMGEGGSRLLIPLLLPAARRLFFPVWA